MQMSTHNRFAAIVGLDWADKKHDVCVQSVPDGAREFAVIEQRPEALDEWANALRVRFGNRPVAVCVELRKGPVIYALSKYEHLVLFMVSPGLVAKIRRALRPSGAKDDPSDAALILDILEKHPGQVRRIDPDDPRTRQLTVLVEARRDLVDQRVRLTNALTSNLKGYFPQALHCFDELGTTLACDFLRNWPSLGEAKRARETTLRTFFHRHGVRGEARIDERIVLLRDALALTTDAGVLLPALLATKILVEQLRAVLAGIERYERAIEKVFKAHPDAAIFASLPGAGPTFAPRLLAVFGSNRERWPDAASLQQYLGVAPVTERSGNSQWVHWRWACPKFLRQSVVEWAGMSVRYSIWAAAYYQDQRNRGKTHNIAVRALAFKWLRILHRCWMDRTPYDEATYLKALQKSGSPLLAMIAAPTAPAR
jgi:transposase